MKSTKNDQFRDQTPPPRTLPRLPPPSTKMNNGKFQHVANFKTPPPSSVWKPQMYDSYLLILFFVSFVIAMHLLKYIFFNLQK